MTKKQNPGPVRRVKASRSRPTRPQPDPFPSDEQLWWELATWAQSMEMAPHIQQAVNFRLLDMLNERRTPFKPMEQAVRTPSDDGKRNARA